MGTYRVSYLLLNTCPNFVVGFAIQHGHQHRLHEFCNALDWDLRLNCNPHTGFHLHQVRQPVP